MTTAEEFAAMIGRSGDGIGCTRADSHGVVQIQLDDGVFYAVADCIEFIHRHMKHLDEGDAVEPPVEPPIEPPPSGPYALDIGAPSLTLINSQGMKLNGERISDWGHPGEAVSVVVHADEATAVTVDLDYVLAAESGSTSVRRVTASSPSGVASEMVTLTKTTDSWGNPVHGEASVDLSLPAGDSTITVAIPDDEPDWSNWADLYTLGLISDKKITTLGITQPPIEPPIEPPTAGTGTLAEVLDAIFPSPGLVQTITWGQNLGTVAPGTTLVFEDADQNVAEWIIRGLRGTKDKWITIKARNLWGFKGRNVQVWRGIGIYDCQYVRVDGLDLYGMGGHNPDGSGDFSTGVELVGGHHIAATRNRCNNTGGHAVAASWSQQDGMNAPANTYMLYNVAYDTSKRNPFNGSAYSLFHGTSKRTPDGPLASQGYTDYIIGNVAFGCRSEIDSGFWGITDGNCFILDVGRDAGYDGNCLVAFNIGADNGGRGVHTLQTDGLVALFNTMVGNQTNVTAPQSGEFSPHTDNGQRCITGGNIAAATVRDPQTWYQDWESGNGNHVVKQNVVLSGTADGANNRAPAIIDKRSQGLGYLKGGTAKSRNVDDYRPKVGDAITDADLVSRFNAIAAVFPDASGKFRTQVICGALDVS